MATAPAREGSVVALFPKRFPSIADTSRGSPFVRSAGDAIHDDKEATPARLIDRNKAVCARRNRARMRMASGRGGSCIRHQIASALVEAYCMLRCLSASGFRQCRFDRFLDLLHQNGLRNRGRFLNVSGIPPST